MIIEADRGQDGRSRDESFFCGRLHGSVLQGWYIDFAFFFVFLCIGRGLESIVLSYRYLDEVELFPLSFYTGCDMLHYLFFEFLGNVLLTYTKSFQKKLAKYKA